VGENFPRPRRAGPVGTGLRQTPLDAGHPTGLTALARPSACRTRVLRPF
jgi:hypothetical protein